MKKRKRNRRLGYDYSQNNLYFVTICVKDMKCCFGEIHSFLQRTSHDLSVPNSDSNFVPNPDFLLNSDANSKLKFISKSKYKKIFLNKYGKIAKSQMDWLEKQYPYLKMHIFVIMPNHLHGILEIKADKKSENIKIKSLSELLGAYKMTTSKLIHLAGMPDFSWHRSFHDHIIRSAKSYNNIFDYIKENPGKWHKDKYHRQ